MGDYELACLAAMRQVEIRVRHLARFGKEVYERPLINAAFGKNGPLRDPDGESGEELGMMEVFAGAIGVFKNPSSHRPVNIEDPVFASEMILLADLLMRILDLRSPG